MVVVVRNGESERVQNGQCSHADERVGKPLRRIDHERPVTPGTAEQVDPVGDLVFGPDLELDRVDVEEPSPDQGADQPEREEQGSDNGKGSGT